MVEMRANLQPRISTAQTPCLAPTIIRLIARNFRYNAHFGCGVEQSGSSSGS